MKITAFNTDVLYADLLWSRWALAQVASLANMVLWAVQQMLSNESLAARIGELSPRNWSWITQEQKKAIVEHVSSDQWKALISDNPHYFDRLAVWHTLSANKLLYLMQECPQIFGDFASKLTQSQAESIINMDQFHQRFAVDVYLMIAKKVRPQFLRPLWEGYIAKWIQTSLTREMIQELVKSEQAQILLNALVAKGDLRTAFWILEETRGDISYNEVPFERLFELLDRDDVPICWETLLPLAGGGVTPQHCALILSKCPFDLSEKLLGELAQSTTFGPWHAFLQQLVKKSTEEPKLKVLVGKYLGMQKTAWSEYIRIEKAWPKRSTVCPRIDSWDEVEVWEKAIGAPFKIEWLQNTLPSVQRIWALQASPEALFAAVRDFQKSSLALTALLELMGRKEELSSLADLRDMSQEEPLKFALGWLLNQQSRQPDFITPIEQASLWFWECFVCRLPKEQRAAVNLSQVKEIHNGRILLKAAQRIWSVEDFANEALRILSQDWSGSHPSQIHDLECLTLTVKEKDRPAFFECISKELSKEKAQQIRSYYEGSEFEAKETMLQFASGAASL